VVGSVGFWVTSWLKIQVWSCVRGFGLISPNPHANNHPIARTPHSNLQVTEAKHRERLRAIAIDWIRPKRNHTKKKLHCTHTKSVLPTHTIKVSCLCHTSLPLPWCTSSQFRIAWGDGSPTLTWYGHGTSYSQMTAHLYTLRCGDWHEYAWQGWTQCSTYSWVVVIMACPSGSVKSWGLHRPLEPESLPGLINFTPHVPTPLMQFTSIRNLIDSWQQNWPLVDSYYPNDPGPLIVARQGMLQWLLPTLFIYRNWSSGIEDRGSWDKNFNGQWGTMIWNGQRGRLLLSRTSRMPCSPAGTQGIFHFLWDSTW